MIPTNNAMNAPQTPRVSRRRRNPPGAPKKRITPSPSPAVLSRRPSIEYAAEILSENGISASRRLIFDYDEYVNELVESFFAD